jgi:hypothetical protein
LKNDAASVQTLYCNGSSGFGFSTKIWRDFAVVSKSESFDHLRKIFRQIYPVPRELELYKLTGWIFG